VEVWDVLSLEDYDMIVLDLSAGDFCRSGSREWVGLLGVYGWDIGGCGFGVCGGKGGGTVLLA
jgi:hypothetical protein